MDTRSAERSRRGRSGRIVAAMAGALLLGGCSDLFEAENPGAIGPELLDNPEMLGALVIGMETAFNSTVDDLVEMAGLLSDELVASGTWPSWHLASKEGFIDLNAGAGNIPDQMWPSVSESRFLAAEVARRAREVLPNAESDRRTALADLYLGMSQYIIADVMCRGTYDGGAPVQPEESYAMAEASLSSAIAVAQAAGAQDVLDMAHLARARARLKLGDWAGAASDAAAVPDGFEWLAEYDLSVGITIGVWNSTRSRNESTVDVRFHETGDPRVPVVFVDGLLGADRETQVWHQEKYPERDSSIPVGRWQEARLIQAEALIETGGDLGQAMALINQVRTEADLEPASAGSVGEAREILRNERAHELFLEGHRMADMRRWGMYPDGWGSSCIPLNRDELDSNPNVS